MTRLGLITVLLLIATKTLAVPHGFLNKKVSQLSQIGTTSNVVANAEIDDEEYNANENEADTDIDAEIEEAIDGAEILDQLDP